MSRVRTNEVIFSVHTLFSKVGKYTSTLKSNYLKGCFFLIYLSRIIPVLQQQYIHETTMLSHNSNADVVTLYLINRT